MSYINVKPTQISVHNPIFGPRNLGHYFGSMRDLVNNQYDYETIVVIDDIAATFMNPNDFKFVQNRSFFVVQDFINAGFDCEQNHIILTSQVIPQILQLAIYYSSAVDLPYCDHLFKNSFLGGLKSYQRDGIGLNNYPSVFEFVYPQFGMPSISLGLDVELFQGGEEIIGYVYIIEEIIEKLKSKFRLALQSPLYEPGRNRMVLGTDGRYMFQENGVYLSDSEEDIRVKIDNIQKKEVLIDWLQSFGYHEKALALKSKTDLDEDKFTLAEIMVSELRNFRENKITNSQITAILNRSKTVIAGKLESRIAEMQEVFEIFQS